MIKNIVTFAFMLFLMAKNSFAYEFNRIDRLFNAIESNHIQKANLVEVSNSIFKTIHNYDNSIRVYNNGTKAFLYKDDILVKAFSLPKKDSSYDLWKNTLLNVVNEASHKSGKIQNNYIQFEKQIVKEAINSIDTYSRIEHFDGRKKGIEFSVDENILYIKTSSFYNGISKDIKDIILSNINCDGLILDLRNNRGGSFNEAILTSDLFLDDAIIAYSIEKDNTTKYFNATTGDIFDGKNIIILVNKYTASASEVVVASLSEQSRATIVGTNTYGKGTLQTTYNEGSDVWFISKGQFYSPSGNKIENIGISPQICTGVGGSCNIDDKNDSKDILFAINLIKNKLG